MAWQDYKDTVQKLYIAFYQRAGDPGGVRFWSQMLDTQGGSLEGIIDAFATSAEAVALYDTNGDGSLDGNDDMGQLVDSIYQALFNRAPDAAGKQFYLDALSNGEFPDGRPATPGRVALDILNGAQGSDLVAIANKLETANNFTNALDPDGDYLPPYTATYAGEEDAQKARDWLATVTADPTTIKYDGEVIDFIAQNIADAGDPIVEEAAQGKVFVLTTGLDQINGTDGNDNFYGSVAGAFATGTTFNPGDSIDGKGGNDTFNLTITADAGGNASNPVLQTTSVENFVVSDYNANNSTIDAGAAVGLQNVTIKGAGGSTTISNLNNIVDVALSGKSGNDAIISYNPAIVGGTDDTQKVTLSNAGTFTSTNVNGVYFDVNGGNGVNAVENLEVTVNAGSNALDISQSAAGNRSQLSQSLKTVKITGDGNLAINLDSNGNNDFSALTSVDASGMTGDLRIINVNTAAASLDVKGGSGDDDIAAYSTNASALGDNNVFDGGDGTDTIRVKAAPTATEGANIKNFEIVRVDASAAATTLDMSVFTNSTIDTIVDNTTGSATSVLTVSNLTNQKIKVVADEAGDDATATTNALTVNAKDPNTALDLTLDESANPDAAGERGIKFGQITTTNIDKLTLTTVKVQGLDPVNNNGDGYAIGTLDSDIATLTIKAGDYTAVTTGDLGANKTFTVDTTGSDANTTVVVDASAQNADVTYTGGDNKDQVTMGLAKNNISTGKGDDTITVAGTLDTNDVIDGGEGTDMLRNDTAAWNLTGNAVLGLNISNIETLYNANNGAGTITIDDGLVSKFGGAVTLRVNGDNAGDEMNASGVLGTGNKVTYQVDNGAAAGVTVTISNGIDTADFTNVTTGRNDTFVVTNTSFLSADDSLNAGAGSDTLKFVGVENQTVTASQLSGLKGFETIQILDDNNNGGNIKTFSLTIDNAFASANNNAGTLTITGDDTAANADVWTLDASAVTSAKLSVTDSAVAGDTIKLGSGDDTITLRDDNGLDTITLGAGKDTVDASGLTYNGTVPGDTNGEAKITDFDFGAGGTNPSTVDTLKLAADPDGDGADNFSYVGDGTGTIEVANGIVFASKGITLADGQIIVLDTTAYSTIGNAEAAYTPGTAGAATQAYVLWQDTLGNVHVSYDGDTQTATTATAAATDIKDILILTGISIADVANAIDAGDFAFA